jgi:YbbR domain-containing protein
LLLPEGITLDSVTEITVSVQIEPFSSTKIYNQPVEILGANEAFEATINPETVRIVLFGPSPILDTLTEQEVRVSVDLFGLGPGEYLLEPDVDIPDRGLELRSIQPSVIEVIISNPISSTDEFTEINRLMLNGLKQPPSIDDLMTAVSIPNIPTHFAWLPKNRAF